MKKIKLKLEEEFIIEFEFGGNKFIFPSKIIYFEETSISNEMLKARLVIESKTINPK